MSEPQDDGLTIPADYVSHIFDISGRVAVITGGASGLGRAIAVGYAQSGARVVLVDINDEGMRETTALIAEQGHAAQIEHVDVTSTGGGRCARRSVVERFGHVDILVNSAGAAFRSPAEEFPEDKLDFIVGPQPQGHVPVLPGLRQARCSRRGRAASSTSRSIGSFIAYPWASAYLASKGGVLGITRGDGARVA